MSRADVAPIIVVLGHYGAEIERVIWDMPIELTRNPKPEEGLTSSLRVGLSSLHDLGQPVMVGLADQPLLDKPSVRALVTAYHDRPPDTLFVVPTRQQQPGNPVMFSPSVAAEILSKDAHYGGKEWKHDHPGQVFSWETQDRGYFTDIDTPEDLQALIESQSKTSRGKAR